MKIKLSICRLIAMGTLTMFIWSCDKNKNDIPTGVRTALVYTTPVKVRGAYAILRGNIIENGGGTITERGLIYGSNPNLNDDTKLGKVIDNTAGSKDAGSFELQINGLTGGGKVYYVRSYAINSAGMNLGNKVSITTKSPIPPGGIEDVDGNVYHVDQIGTQFWLRENLATNSYNDGTPIPQVQDAGAWGALKTGCFAVYDGKVENANIYGNLYNWHAVKTGKLAPVGWHVPTKAEWKTLIDFMGGNGTAGKKAKEAGTDHWPAPNAATNNYNFTGLPAGFFYPGAGFIGLGSNAGGLALFHTSTPHAGNEDIYSDRTQLGGGDSFDELYWIQEAGASVRCIKD